MNFNTGDTVWVRTYTPEGEVKVLGVVIDCDRETGTIIVSYHLNGHRLLTVFDLRMGNVIKIEQ